ncbi:MAG TPA: hypothetical protein VEZ50_14050 [Nodosilinea sp.]|nr:hypothetical protein [Nodosilinea sp.]
MHKAVIGINAPNGIDGIERYHWRNANQQQKPSFDFFGDRKV